MHLLTLGAIASVMSWQLIQDASPLTLSRRHLITHFFSGSNKQLTLTNIWIVVPTRHHLQPIIIHVASYLYTLCYCAVLLPVLLVPCLLKLRLLLFSVPVKLSEAFFATGLALGRTLLKFPSRIHSCRSPSSGVIRLVGSQLRAQYNNKVIIWCFIEVCKWHKIQFHYQCNPVVFLCTFYIREAAFNEVEEQWICCF